ncbi:disintegrin and metalloproteinase domain-containing protein 23 isoform X2 [Antennarius striatus]|uniref:disintegrin and metalloproteinase domain-containing protein 23 isoform X2 n=1 Tax=Antennarius striatus TaxID=241820 RepID=UPI0035B2D92E
MYVIFLATVFVSILSPRLLSSLASFASQEVEDKIERDAVPALPKQQATAAPATDNRTHHAAEHVITYPSRLIYYLNEDLESTYHDLDTRAKNQAPEGKAVHLAQASFQLEAFGSRFVLDLALNNDLLSSDYVEIHFEGGKPVLSKGGEHCYYHGQVRGNDISRVALSTCNGLHGMFDDGVYMYLIEPLQQTHSIDTAARPHKLKRTASFDWNNESEEQVEEELFSETDGLSWLKRRKKRAMPRNIFEEMKYLEIMIVSDHSMYKRHKTKQHTRNFAKSVVNLVDAVFKEQLHTRVVLVAVEIWTDKDHIPISVRPLEMLRDFSKYRQQSIKHRADAVHLISNVTFHYRRSSAAYFGGMCSSSRGVGVNEYGHTLAMAISLSQGLAQNLGIQWDPVSKRKECGCVEMWTGCIMEDTGVQHPRRFSKCSITDFKDFLKKGGGSCLFNRPTNLFETTECGNGFVEVGEDCDCGARSECYKECCKKCSLANGAHCSDGPCCNNTCLFYPRGYSCRYAVNDCDITETCSGDSGQCPPNLHKQDGYLCQIAQGRCYNGECKTREAQCKYIWGPSKIKVSLHMLHENRYSLQLSSLLLSSESGGSEKFCYEKLNTEGTEKGNCGKDGDKWIQCSKHDVFCGYLLCTNIGRNPRIGIIKGDITPASFNHQGRLVDCSGGHVLLDDETDLGYVEDGTPCGPSMMCLDRKCLPIQSLNMSTCPTGPNGQVCSAHGVCNNEATCTCDTTWAGTDCSMPDPPKEPEPTQDEGPKVSVATNRLIGAVAGTILALGVIFGGTGWGIENVKKRRYDPNATAI